MTGFGIRLAVPAGIPDPGPRNSISFLKRSIPTCVDPTTTTVLPSGRSRGPQAHRENRIRKRRQRSRMGGGIFAYVRIL